MDSIKTAVILAAGLGMRLRDVCPGKPKGLLALDGLPLVERSIQQLRRHGIRKIIIATGYLAADYEALAAAYAPLVQTVHNEHYADSGSMYSLYCARDLVDEPFLLLESDLLYEDRALATLLAFPAPDAILLSGPTHSTDEMYVEARANRFYAMSKERAKLQSVSGEMVGISKISRPLFQQMIDHAAAYFRKSRHLHYEDGCLNQLAHRHPIALCKVEDLIWTEIDNASHLRRAETLIWPAIRRQETAHSRVRVMPAAHQEIAQ